MFNNLFQQGMPANNSFAGGMPMNGFAQNNGLNFGNVVPAKTSTSTAEEMSLIKSNKKSNFSISDEELAIYGWDLREGTNLAIEIIDPATERVRVKYTGDEFNIVMQPVEVLKKLLKILKDFSMTARLTDTSSPREESKQLNTAFGIVEKLLPQSYVNGQKNYQQLCNMMQNQMTSQGFQGTWNNGMFNGTIGGVANYVVPDGSTMGAFQQNNMMNGMTNPQVMQMAQQIAQQMVAQQQMANNNAIGMPTMPVTPTVNGGTMMGNNPFVQGGQPQMTSPTTPNLNSIPMPPIPGAPVTPTATPNPSIGSTAANTTTTVTI